MGSCHHQLPSRRARTTTILPVKRPLEYTLTAIALLIVGGCSEQSSPVPTEPTTPEAIRITVGADQVGTVGQPLPEQLTILITGQRNKPVPGVDVSFTVTAGGGSVEPAVVRTGADGTARTTWTLGTKAGPQTVAATAAGLQPVVFSAEARPGPAEALTVVSGDGQAGKAGEPLATPLVVEVSDAYGNPVAGMAVTWSTESSGGQIDPDSGTTDANGRAEASWRLGTRRGEQHVTASAGQSASTVFTAVAAPGPAAGVSAASGDGQIGIAGKRLGEPLVVRVTDAYGNGVPGVTVQWDVAAGGGSVDPATSMTMADGQASTWLTLGATPGSNSVAALVSGMLAVAFNATAIEPFDLSSANVYMVQSVQTLAGDVPLVAGRDALLRVFVVGSDTNSQQPDVQVELFNGATRIAQYTIPASSASVPLAENEGDLLDSWNVFVPGNLIVPGLGIRVTVDPNDVILEVDEENNIFPGPAGVHALDVRSLPVFDVHFVPIQASGLTGDVTEANVHTYLAEALKVFPLPGANVSVRSQPFVSSVNNDGSFLRWVDILHEMLLLLHAVEGATSHYYGVLARVNTSPGIGLCGLAYPGTPVAIGRDDCGSWTAAHEWGHNFGGLHVACGVTGEDPDYPYLDGSIGVYGYDTSTGEVKTPGTDKDLMSYCDPMWISDYTFRAVLAFREAEAAAQAAYAVAREPSLVVWGRMNGSSLTLEPAFEIETRPSLPARPGPYRLQGLDASGDAVFEISFAGEVLADGPADVRHFTFAIPASMARPDRLERLRLVGPGAPVAERARLPIAAPAQGQAEPMIAARVANMVELRWDAAADPLIVARDPRTGNILGFARGGSMELPTDAAEIDLIVSDGVRSTRQRVEVQRLDRR